MRSKLSVNINKVATLRNARGGNVPDLCQFALDCEAFGADGITVHPRPDERHIKYEDVLNLKAVLKTEFNIEGNPTETFMDLVLKVKPDQVTLVPDADDALTSNAGWNTIKHEGYLREIITRLQAVGIRTSIFLDPDTKYLESAKRTGTDRIELYTESYAAGYKKDKHFAIKDYIDTAHLATKLNIGLNAGHDLNLQNLDFFKHSLPNLLEVSIGHALISDSLYYGIHNTIQMYKWKLG